MNTKPSPFNCPARFPRAILAASAASLLAAVLTVPQARAQIQIGAPTVYSQDFDTLPTVAGNWTDNSTLTGWYATSMNTFPATGVLAPLPLAVYTTGAARASGFFSAGTGTERALAWAGTTTGYGASAMGVVFENTSGNTLAIGNITFNGEMYVGQANANALDGLQFFYQIGNTAVTNMAGTAVHANGAAYAANAALDDTGWTRISGLEYFDSVATAGQIQNPAKIKAIGTNAGLSLAPGEFITLRWRGFNDSGTDGMVGIDDLAVNFLSAPNNLIYDRNTFPSGIVQIGGGNVWLNGGNPAALSANDNVFFSQAGNATLDVQGSVPLNTINITAASGTNTFTGAGSMSGALIKSGAGSAVLGNANTFTSLTISEAGVLQATVPQTISGPITAPFDPDGTPTIQTDADVTATSLNGAGALIKTGTAALVLTGTSAGTGAGGVSVTQGSLRTATAGALGPRNIAINGAGASLTFTHAAGDQTLAGGTTITPGASGAEINIEGAAVGVGVIINSANRLIGGNTITKTGPGILRMAANQAFTGNWIINGGAVQYGTGLATAMGTGSVTINAGGELAGTNTVVPVASIILNGGALGTRTGALTDFTGTVDVTANSEARLRSISTPTGVQPFTISGVLMGGGDLSLTGNVPLTDSGGTAQLRLTGNANTFTGTFRVTQFQTLTSERIAGTGSSLNGRPVVLSGGRLRILDNGTVDNGSVGYGNNVTVDSGVASVDVNRQTAGIFSGNAIQLGTLDIAAGTTLGSTGANGYQAHFLGATTVSGVGDVTFNPTSAPLILVGGLGAGGYGVIKNGTGVFGIAGNAAYTGNTVINEGTFGTNGQLTGTPRIDIKTGATLDVTLVGGGFNVGAGQTLAGTGAVNGSTVVLNGGAIEGGDAAGAGTLTTGPLTLGTAAGNTATIRTSAGNAGGSLLVGGTNTLVANGGVSSVTVNVFGPQPTLGSHILIDYDGTIGGGTGFASFTLGSLPPRTVATLVDNAGDSIGLNVTLIDYPCWSGAAGSTWSTALIAAPKNWVLASNNLIPTDYIESDKVFFDDIATATLVEINGVNVLPQEVIFDNKTKPYTLQGNAGIEGPIGITKNGNNLATSVLTINNDNVFTGPVTMNAGTVKVAAVAANGLPSPLGAGTNLNFNGGTLEYTGALGATNRTATLDAGGGTVKNDAASPLTLSGVLSGVGGLTKSGTGVLTLTGQNTYGGVTTLADGSLNVGSAETAGTSGPLGASAAANPGSIVFAGGTLQHSAANVNDYSGRFSTAGGQAYKVDTNGQNVTWATDLTSAGGTLAKSGAGNLTLGGPGNNTFGDTTVTGGTLIAGKAAGVIAIPGNLVIGTGATFIYVGNNVSDQIADTASVIIDGGTFGDPANVAPTNPGATDKILSLTIVNGGRFGSGRNIPIVATPTFEITDTLTVTGGFALAQRGGGITAATVVVAGPGAINLDGGSTTVGQQSHLRVGTGGLTLVDASVNFNAGPSTVAAGSMGSIVALNGDVTSAGTSSFARLNPTLSVAVVDLLAAVRTFDVTGLLTIAPDMGAATDLGTGGIVKTGAGQLVLEGVQSYASLTNDAGRTDVLKTIGTGTSTLTANAGTVNLGESNTFASVDIADGATVNLGMPFSAAPALAALESGGASVAAVPEPGSASLLLGGLAMLLGARRRK